MKSKTLGLIATIARTNALTNGGRAPIPSKMLNQRQKRKLNRQTNNYK